MIESDFYDWISNSKKTLGLFSIYFSKIESLFIAWIVNPDFLSDYSSSFFFFLQITTIMITAMTK